MTHRERVDVCVIPSLVVGLEPQQEAANGYRRGGALQRGLLHG